jgi:predicted transcriptional regulator
MLSRYFLSERIVQYILVLGDWEFSNILRLAVKTKMVYPYAYKITDLLLSLDIIKTEKKGKEVKVELTDKGKEIYKHLKEISNIVELYK